MIIFSGKSNKTTSTNVNNVYNMSEFCKMNTEFCLIGHSLFGSAYCSPRDEVLILRKGVPFLDEEVPEEIPPPYGVVDLANRAAPRLGPIGNI